LTIDKNNKKCQILKHYFAGILDWVPVEFNNPQDSGAVFWGPLWAFVCVLKTCRGNDVITHFFILPSVTQQLLLFTAACDGEMTLLQESFTL